MRAFVGLDPPARVSTGDVAPNRTEAVRHVQAMTAWTEHQRVRSEQMGSMMGIGWDARRRHDGGLPAERRRVLHTLGRRADDAVSRTLLLTRKRKDQP